MLVCCAKTPGEVHLSADTGMVHSTELGKNMHMSTGLCSGYEAMPLNNYSEDPIV